MVIHNRTSYSTSAKNNYVCRICYDEEDQIGLISPCKCLGSHSFVHKKCLETWLSIIKKPICEICKYQYRMHFVRFKNFSEWKFPKPLTESLYDKIGFYLAIIYLSLNLVRFTTLFLTFGISETFGAGIEHLVLFFSGGFSEHWPFICDFINTVFFSFAIYSILRKWWKDHQIYEWDFMKLN